MERSIPRHQRRARSGRDFPPIDLGFIISADYSNAISDPLHSNF
jgi:hypothetical protein